MPLGIDRIELSPEKELIISSLETSAWPHPKTLTPDNNTAVLCWLHIHLTPSHGIGTYKLQQHSCLVMTSHIFFLPADQNITWFLIFLYVLRIIRDLIFIVCLVHKSFPATWTFKLHYAPSHFAVAFSLLIICSDKRGGQAFRTRRSRTGRAQVYTIMEMYSVHVSCWKSLHRNMV